MARPLWCRRSTGVVIRSVSSSSAAIRSAAGHVGAARHVRRGRNVRIHRRCLGIRRPGRDDYGGREELLRIMAPASVGRPSGCPDRPRSPQPCAWRAGRRWSGGPRVRGRMRDTISWGARPSLHAAGWPQSLTTRRSPSEPRGVSPRQPGPSPIRGALDPDGGLGPRPRADDAVGQLVSALVDEIFIPVIMLAEALVNEQDASPGELRPLAI